MIHTGDSDYHSCGQDSLKRGYLHRLRAHQYQFLCIWDIYMGIVSALSARTWDPYVFNRVVIRKDDCGIVTLDPTFNQSSQVYIFLTMPFPV